MYDNVGTTYRYTSMYDNVGTTYRCTCMYDNVGTTYRCTSIYDNVGTTYRCTSMYDNVGTTYRCTCMYDNVWTTYRYTSMYDIACFHDTMFITVIQEVLFLRMAVNLANVSVGYSLVEVSRWRYKYRILRPMNNYARKKVMNV